ncbi:quinone oxidoreductase [Scheffersomyces amazonensis]|uniref:quinone oxidoreductase n=1 Tax=Scheffersomyces amazonensis TaxID=1078765 RepID=UPI00315CB071
MSIKATSVVLKNAPLKDVNYEWDQSDSTFEIKTQNLDASTLKDGEVLAKILYISNDPTQRTWMQKDQDVSRAYAPPIRDGDAVSSLALAEVVHSKSSKYKVGEIINARLAWADYVITDESNIFNAIDKSQQLPLEFYLSCLGMTSLTAYFGLVDAGKLKPTPEGEKGPIIAISAASGATGSIAVQLAKNVFGASKVIGISGSEEKAKWVESIGADKCFNYHDPNYKQQLADYLQGEFIDVYFDNVGGEILSFLLTKVKKFGRVIACGSIAGYNDKSKSYVTSWTEIIVQSLRVQGFIVTNYSDRFPEAFQVLGDAVKSGKINAGDSYHLEDISNETNVELKLKQIPQIWKQLFGDSKPNAKLITKL